MFPLFIWFWSLGKFTREIRFWKSISSQKKVATTKVPWVQFSSTELVKTVILEFYLFIRLSTSRCVSVGGYFRFVMFWLCLFRVDWFSNFEFILFFGVGVWIARIGGGFVHFFFQRGERSRFQLFQKGSTFSGKFSNFPEFFVFFGTKGEFISRKRKNLSFQRFSSVEKNIFEKFCWALSCGIGGGAGADRCDTDFWSSCSFSDPVEVDSLLTDSRDEWWFKDFGDFWVVRRLCDGDKLLFFVNFVLFNRIFKYITSFLGLMTSFDTKWIQSSGTSFQRRCYCR